VGNPPQVPSGLARGGGGEVVEMEEEE